LEWLRSCLRNTAFSFKFLLPWAPALSSLPSHELKRTLKHLGVQTDDVLMKEELVSLTQKTLWWSLLANAFPLLLGTVAVAYCSWASRTRAKKLRWACQDWSSRRPQWVLGKLAVYFLTTLNVLLTLSALLSWTQQKHGFPRGLVDWLLTPVYFVVDMLLGRGALELATGVFSLNLVPLFLSFLCQRLLQKLRIWMLSVREWDEGEGWVRPGQYPPVRIDLGNPEGVRKLVSMGFDERRSAQALSLSNNDVDMAAARLLEQK